MKIFRSDAEQDNSQAQKELQEQFELLEHSVGELGQTIGYQRTLLKNAEKKLQEFQDTIYAMLIEDEYPRKKSAIIQDDDNASPPFQTFSE